ncbi:MAG: CPBP family intramembrane metalloprotease [Bacteroidaceae bacterium]|nr:CPBP family intramembrane metalloprotease [Bacteroidaceae bacterium]
MMNALSRILKPIMPILAAVYGLMMIYMTAMPMADGNETLGRQGLSWGITLAAIALTYVLVRRVEPSVFPEAKQFSLKLPTPAVVLGLLLLAPLWGVAEGYVVYGLTSLIHTVQMEPITYTPEELREDLLASVHAILLAPVLEELCYRQLAISPFRRRGAQIIVCVVMALLFGILHVRNFLGASIDAMLYGLVFIWTRNIWYAVILHMGHNLMATLLAIYCMLGLGEIQMSKTPVILLPDTTVVVTAVIMALIGWVMLSSLFFQK